MLINYLSRWPLSKLSGMFSGYGQTSAVVFEVLNAVEKYMDRTQQFDRALEHLEEWDTGGKSPIDKVTVDW